MDTFKCAMCNQMCFELNNVSGNDICEHCRNIYNIENEQMELLIELREALKDHNREFKGMLQAFADLFAVLSTK